MARKVRQVMVIDASVARSAGRTDHARSRRCRAFLQWALKYCHSLAMSAEIDKEWKKHQSRFTRAWRLDMVQRDKVRNLGSLDSGPLKNRIQSLKLSKPSEQAAVEKDALLVVAAQAADRIVVSLDNAARDLFIKHAARLRTPRGIKWRNPEEEPIPWA